MEIKGPTEIDGIGLANGPRLGLALLSGIADNPSSRRFFSYIFMLREKLSIVHYCKHRYSQIILQ